MADRCPGPHHRTVLPNADTASPDDPGEASHLFLATEATPWYRRYETALRRWLDDNEMAIDADVFLSRAPACVVLIPRVLQMHPSRVSNRHTFTGPCLDLSRMTGWRPVAGDERLLACVAVRYLACIDRADVCTACIDALAASSGWCLPPARRIQPCWDPCRMAWGLDVHARSIACGGD